MFFFIFLSLIKRKEEVVERDGYFSFISSITGISEDFQEFDRTKETLESISGVVMPLHFQASMLVIGLKY